jgi:hypothetical protein
VLYHPVNERMFTAALYRGRELVERTELGVFVSDHLAQDACLAHFGVKPKSVPPAHPDLTWTLGICSRCNMLQDVIPVFGKCRDCLDEPTDRRIPDLSFSWSDRCLEASTHQSQDQTTASDVENEASGVVEKTAPYAPKPEPLAPTASVSATPTTSRTERVLAGVSTTRTLPGVGGNR